jgi:DNA-3-methyladenine glycosylase
MNVQLPNLSRPVESLAPDLLGCLLRTQIEGGEVVVRITEVEAYGGELDPASHAYGGRTQRNSVMFGPPGHLYVYRSHGLHWCVNVTTGQEGDASAVLLRAGEVIEGEGLARDRRGERATARNLARGPGNLGQALGLSSEHYGLNLLSNGPVQLRPRTSAIGPVCRGPRVGVSRADDWPWRWWLEGEPSVSAYRKAAKRS